MLIATVDVDVVDGHDCGTRSWDEDYRCESVLARTIAKHGLVFDYVTPRTEVIPDVTFIEPIRVVRRYHYGNVGRCTHSEIVVDFVSAGQVLVLA